MTDPLTRKLKAEATLLRNLSHLATMIDPLTRKLKAEATLLRNLGHLATLIDERLIQGSLSLFTLDGDDAFHTVTCSHSGHLSIGNLFWSIGDQSVSLYVHQDATDDWPLWFSLNDPEEIEVVEGPVFEDNTPKLSSEFYELFTLCDKV
jgi:hypothetical protein